MADGTSYLGSPPMLLPRRQGTQGTFDVASTFNPTWSLYAQRLTFEFFRITMPFMFMSACMLMYMGNFEYLLFQYNDSYLSLAFFWTVIWPCCYIGAAFACCFIVLLFKWLLVGTYTASEQPLWSNFGTLTLRSLTLTVETTGCEEAVVANSHRGVSISMHRTFRVDCRLGLGGCWFCCWPPSSFPAQQRRPASASPRELALLAARAWLAGCAHEQAGGVHDAVRA